MDFLFHLGFPDQSNQESFYTETKYWLKLFAVYQLLVPEMKFGKRFAKARN